MMRIFTMVFIITGLINVETDHMFQNVTKHLIELESISYDLISFEMMRSKKF